MTRRHSETVAQAGASVIDHRFGTAEPYTVGAEEELMLLDPESFDLAPAAASILDAAHTDAPPGELKSELMQPFVEIASPVCATVSELGASLTALRRHVLELAGARGLRVASAGTHPFALPERQPVTDAERYREIVERYQLVARQQLIFGLHFHVAVSDPETAIRVVDGFAAHLPELVALSANSPFWRGEQTGLASYRQVVFSMLPRTGIPPTLSSYQRFVEIVSALQRTDCISDYTSIWWDVRPHPLLGTVEVRVSDAVTRLDDAIALGAYVQSLVKLLSERPGGGPEASPVCHTLLEENKWLAARYGLEASLVDLASEAHGRIGLASLIERELETLEPHARELGCERELRGITEILARGNGASAQLELWREHGGHAGLVRALSLASELPAPSSGQLDAADRGGRGSLRR